MCRTCEESGQSFVEAPLRACHRCIAFEKQCISLFIPVCTADYKESNKQAMQRLIEVKKNGTVSAELQFLLPLSEATHVAKSQKVALRTGSWSKREKDSTFPT